MTLQVTGDWASLGIMGVLAFVLLICFFSAILALLPSLSSCATGSSKRANRLHMRHYGAWMKTFLHDVLYLRCVSAEEAR